MNIKSMVVSFCAGAALAASAIETNLWLTTTANTPLTPHLWTNGANWKNIRTGLTGTVPDAADLIRFPRGYNPYFVQLPDEVNISRLESVSPGNATYTNAIFIGKKWILGDHNRASCYGGLIFADVYTRREGDVNDVDTWFSNAHIAGRLIVPHADTGDTRGALVSSSAFVYLRLDYFATSPDALRTDDLQLPAGCVRPGDASVQIMAGGADASSSTWNLTPGSPYIQAVGAYAPVAVGATVTGAGIAEGTWVRRRFADTGWLELSASVLNEATAGSAQLQFAAHHPDARIGVNNWESQTSGTAGDSYIVLTKAHAQDQLVVEVTNLCNTATKGMRWGLGAPLSNVASKMLPGTLKIRKVVSYRAAPVTLTHNLYNAHIELAGTETESVVFNDKCLVGFGDTGSVVRITVPAGKTSEIVAFTNFNGTLVKDGPGTLKIGLVDHAGTGSVTVEEGTLEFSVNADTATPGFTFDGALTMTGGVLAIPTAGLRFKTATFTAAATVRGAGTVLIDGMRDAAAPQLEDGAQLRYGGSALVHAYVHQPQAEVAGHPAFWVDASKRDTLVLENEGDVDYVRRWNDCREGEPMFATNIIRRPVLNWGEQMADRYVNISHIDTSFVTNTEGLVWSVPIDHIRAVFMVLDPRGGVGKLLGRTARLADDNYGTQGGAFYGGHIADEKYGTKRVYLGRFFRNGTEFAAYNTYYTAGTQVLEFHANTNEWCRAGVKEEFICDAFGTGCYQDGNSQKNDSGYQRLSEVLIYTNSLTHAERVQTALYLSRKWLGNDIAYSDVDETSSYASATLSAGEGVCVAADATIGIQSFEEGGPLVKDGAGQLVVNLLQAGGVRVNGGELLVKSMSLANTSVPGTPWTHMDAQDTASVTTNAAGQVSRWASVGGDAQSYKPIDLVLPVYRLDTVTGLPMIDCGAFNTSSSAALQLHLADDTVYIHDNSYSGFISSPALCDTFIVCSSAGGGGSLLGAWGNGYPWQGIPHDGSTNAITSEMVGTYYPWDKPTEGKALSITNGSYVLRCNAEVVNPLVTPFSGTTDIFSFSGKNGYTRKSDTLACFGQIVGKKGGLAYGEVLLYTNRLDDALRPKVEGWLRQKWFGVTTPDLGSRPATCDSLFVATGAKLTIADWAFMRGGDVYDSGVGAITTGALGGGGTVEGNVTLTADGELLAEVENGRLPTLVVNGSVKLPSALTVRVSGDTATLVPGVYTLLTANGIAAGDVATWHVVVPAKPHRVVRPFVEEGAIKVTVFGRGFIINIR